MALETYLANHTTFPLPDDYVEIKYSWETLTYQGKFGKNVVSELSSMKQAPKDPKDNTYYTYTVSADKKNYELLAMMEWEPEKVAYNPFVEAVYADDYTDRIPKTEWEAVWVVLDENNNPIEDITKGTLDLDGDTLYKMVYDNKNIVEGTGIVFKSLAAGDSRLAEGLIGYWDFDHIVGTTVKDISNHWLDWILTGDELPEITGWLIGSGLWFQGDDASWGMVDIKYKPILDSLVNGYTIVAFVKINYSYKPADHPWNCILAKFNQTWRPTFFFGLNRSGFIHHCTRLVNSSSNNNRYCSLEDGGTPSDDKWIMLVGKFDRGKKYNYIWDKLVYQKDIQLNGFSKIYNTSWDLYIGKDGPIRASLRGYIDELRLYNRPLTDEEIKALYNWFLKYKQ